MNDRVIDGDGRFAQQPVQQPEPALIPPEFHHFTGEFTLQQPVNGANAAKADILARNIRDAGVLAVALMAQWRFKVTSFRVIEETSQIIKPL